MNRCRKALAAIVVVAGVGFSAPGRALDLETVLSQVASSNPSLEARRAMVEAARRRVGPAGAWSHPMIEVGVSNLPTTLEFDQDPMTMKMVGFTQRIPLFGSKGMSRRAASEAVKGESAGMRAASFELFGTAWVAYADAYYAAQLARHAEAHQGVMDRLVRSARARYEAGTGRLEDVLRSESERARTRADQVAFQSEERAAHSRLDAVRGVPPGQDGETLEPPPTSEVPADPATWFAAIDAAHPRLGTLEAQAARHRLDAQAARRMRWPDLELRGSYGRREDLAASPTHGPTTTVQEDLISASVGFMVPIFAGSRENAEAAEMEAMARAADSERRAAELSLREEVAAAHAAAMAARRTEALLADTVVVTQQRATDASWSAYTAGATDLWRVFEATHALYAEEIALVRTRQELARAQARMIALTGRSELFGIALPEVAEAPR
jgi:outer membrane protein TolC